MKIAEASLQLGIATCTSMLDMLHWYKRDQDIGP